MNYKLQFYTEKNIRLDEFLRENLPSKLKNPENASNSKIRRLIISGSVYVNKKQIRRPAFELRGKSEINVQFDDEKFFYEKMPDDIKFTLSEKNVLFEDEYLIIVNKPAFFPTEETIVGSEKRCNLHDEIVRYLWKKNPSLRNPPYVGIMHRLDRETSGAILFTKSRSVNKAIQEMFENRDLKKIYVAISEKPFSFSKKIPSSFSVEMFMNRISSKTQRAKWGRVPEKKGGLYSKTNFTILCEKTFDEKKCLEIQAELFTGRTHQIRVHLSEKGLPILGDELYGGKPYKRIMLHSFRLEFVHPVTKKFVSVFARIPF